MTDSHSTDPREPQQERSRATLDRLLTATEALLQEKPWEALSVAEIVQRAHSSTGAFYARFPSKEALLPALYARLSERLQREAAAEADPAAWGPPDLAERVPRLVARVFNWLRESRAVVRPLALYVRQHPGAVSDPDRAIRGGMHRLACAFLLQCRAEIRHPHPETAVETAVYLIAAVGRDRVLFGDAPHSSTVPLPDAELEAELARAVVAYLTGN